MKYSIDMSGKPFINNEPVPMDWIEDIVDYYIRTMVGEDLNFKIYELAEAEDIPAHLIRSISWQTVERIASQVRDNKGIQEAYDRLIFDEAKEIVHYNYI